MPVMFIQRGLLASVCDSVCMLTRTVKGSTLRTTSSSCSRYVLDKYRRYDTHLLPPALRVHRL